MCVCLSLIYDMAGCISSCSYHEAAVLYVSTIYTLIFCYLFINLLLLFIRLFMYVSVSIVSTTYIPQSMRTCAKRGLMV